MYTIDVLQSVNKGYISLMFGDSSSVDIGLPLPFTSPFLDKTFAYRYDVVFACSMSVSFWLLVIIVCEIRALSSSEIFVSFNIIPHH